MIRDSEVYQETLDNYNKVLYSKLNKFHSSRKGGLNCNINSLKELWIYYSYLKTFEDDDNYDFQIVDKLNIMALNLNKL